jgi:hypothetical protein
MVSQIDHVEEAGEAVVKETITYRHAIAILAAAALCHERPCSATHRTFARSHPKADLSSRSLRLQNWSRPCAGLALAQRTVHGKSTRSPPSLIS